MKYLKKMNVYTFKKKNQFKFVVGAIHFMNNQKSGLNISACQKILFPIPTQPFGQSHLSFVHTKRDSNHIGYPILICTEKNLDS